MDSTSAHHKLRKVGEGVKNEESVDRISSLPDAVLCHILSFLPTKYALGTSILSTRWRYLFASIPILDFDDSLLLHPREENENPAREMTTFMNLIERVLLLRKAACIERFRLKCGQNIDASRVNGWICAALCHNIRELELHISMKQFSLLPRNLFTCRTLAVLKLGENFVLNVPMKVSLPNLNIIHLKGFEFVDDDSIQRLISSCPVLEDLVILGCGWGNIRTFNISAPALKRLTINCFVGVEFSTEFCKYQIMIDAPSLVYLKYYDFVPKGFSARNLQSLVIADIDVAYGSQHFIKDNPDHDETVAEVLIGISKARFLYFSENFMEVFRSYVLPEPKFSNVSHLELGIDKYVGCRMMPHFLQSTPLLQTLTVVQGLLDYDHGNDYLCQWVPPVDVPSCLLYHLETIEIDSFEGHKEELNMVKYF